VSAAEVEAKYPKWREQIIGHSLRAGDLTFTDCAALLEDMASGGYPHHQVGDDRVAVRIAIVARAAELLRAGRSLQDTILRQNENMCRLYDGGKLLTVQP
jgi:hypothetical protein